MIVLANIKLSDYLKFLAGTFNSNGGALRDSAGKIKALPELIKPNELLMEAGKLLNTPGVASVSSIVNNVQTAHLQKTANEIKQMTEQVLESVNKLENVANNIKLLSCANLAVSGATLATSIIGDVIIAKKIDNISETIKTQYKQQSEIAKCIDDLIEFEKINQIGNYYKLNPQMISDSDILINIIYHKSDSADVRLDNIVVHLNETRSYLITLIESFINTHNFKINPNYIFELAENYFKTCELYITCLKYMNKHINSRIIVEWEKPIKMLLSINMSDALYTYTYNSINEFPSEETIINSIDLSMSGIAQNYNNEYRCLIEVINASPDIDIIDFSKIKNGTEYVNSIRGWIDCYEKEY